LLIHQLPKDRKIRTLILNLIPPRNFWDNQEYMSELVELTSTAYIIEVVEVISRNKKPHPVNFIGKGRLQDAKSIVESKKVDLVICNGLLSSNQLLTLQRELCVSIWDKVDLVLKIFEQHAKTKEAKLQIKLAKLKYAIPRIYTYHATTLFERAGAGIGTRGVGEKGVESEKRHYRKQIKQIEEKIEKYKKIRANQRRKRQQKNLPIVSIIGYTNVGKSTLLNTITNKKVYIADELFATLDTRIARVWSQKLQRLILFSDTIGFIRDLPIMLVESFKATLQEIEESDLILHVFDGSDPKWKEKVNTVQDIIKQIGCEHIPQIYVANKNDQGCPLNAPKDTFFTCALNKKTLHDLFKMIENVFVKCEN